MMNTKSSAELFQKSPVHYNSQATMHGWYKTGNCSVHLHLTLQNKPRPKLQPNKLGSFKTIPAKDEFNRTEHTFAWQSKQV